MLDSRAEHDMIVVGGGPGGAAAALGAARRGLRVLVLDRHRFPRDKVCGDALTPFGVNVLAELGLIAPVRRVAEELSSVAFGFGAGARHVALSTPMLVVPRRRLDALLLDAVRPLATVREGWQVDGLLRSAAGVCGVTGRTETGERFEARARVVVGADGASSVVARLTASRGAHDARRLLATRAYYRGVTLDERALEFHFLPELDGGYVWIFPSGGDCYSVGLALDADRLRAGGRSLGAWRQACLASPALAARFAGAEPVSRYEGGSIPYTGRSQPLWGPGFVLVGDAAGLADAFWGDGIDTALVSGVLAGAHVARACRAEGGGAADLSGYAAAVARILGPKLDRGLAQRRAAPADLGALSAHLLGA
ncbi:MAG TPA: NAD(P)/FAD-dependent oxidoreductase [Vicinamibacteria bacterium]